MEHKGAGEFWEIFKNTFLEAQNQFIPLQDKGSRLSKRPPWIICDLDAHNNVTVITTTTLQRISFPLITISESRKKRVL